MLGETHKIWKIVYDFVSASDYLNEFNNERTRITHLNHVTKYFFQLQFQSSIWRNDARRSKFSLIEWGFEFIAYLCSALNIGVILCTITLVQIDGGIAFDFLCTLHSHVRSHYSGSHTSFGKMGMNCLANRIKCNVSYLIIDHLFLFYYNIYL